MINLLRRCMSKAVHTSRLTRCSTSLVQSSRSIGISVENIDEEPRIARDLFTNELHLNNKVLINAEIDNKAVTTVICSLLQRKSQGHTSVHISFNTGHDAKLTAVFALYDLIEELKKADITVQTSALSSLRSPTSLLLAAGTPGYRYSQSNVIFPMSQTFVRVQGTTASVTAKQNFDITDVYQKMDKKMKDLYAKHSRLKDRLYIEEAIDQQKYISAEEAKNYGIIDHII